MSNILNSKAAMEVAVLVDQYRHEHQAMEDYLDQHASRGKMEVALRGFYERQGISVTDEIISAGIEAYERNRFTYKGIQGGIFAKGLAKAYLTVFKNKRSLTISTVASIAFGISWYFWAEASLESKIAQREADISSTIAAIEKSNEALAGVDTSKMIYAKAAATSLSKTIANQMQDEKALILKAKDTGSNDVGEITARVGTAMQSIRELQALIQSDLTLQRVEKTDLYVAHKNSVDIITHRANLLLTMAEAKGVEALNGANKLDTMLIIKERSQSLLAVLDETVPRLAAGFKDESGKQRLSNLDAAARYAASQGDQQGFTKEMQRIQDLSSYVMTELKVTINGQDTGFSRSKDDIKHYFLVLEALDHSGKAHPHEVLNAETNKIELVSRWGQRVAESEFRRVAADKKSDGVVDDAAFGLKPAGYYDIQYSRPHLGTSITRW